VIPIRFRGNRVRHTGESRYDVITYFR